MLKGMLTKLKGMKAMMLKVVTPSIVAGTIFVGGIATTNNIQQAIVSNPCYSFGSSSSGGGALDGVWREIYQSFASQGYGDAAIAGILGNVKAEGGGNPALDAGPAKGLFMFEKSVGNASGLDKFAASKGKKWTDVAVQCEYVHSKLASALEQMTGKVTYPYARYGRGNVAVGWPKKMNIEQFKKQKNPQTVAQIFCRVYERPSIPRMDKRKTFAQEFYQQIKTGSGSGGVGDITASVKDGKGNAASIKLAKTALSMPNGLASNSCAKWVRLCHEKAGVAGWKQAVGAYQTAMAYKSAGMLHTKMNKIPVGACVFGSGSGSAGATYGHVGIYIGNGKVMDQSRAGTLGQNIITWCSWQTATNSGGERGWIGWVLTTSGKKTGDAGDVFSENDTPFDCGGGEESVSEVPYYSQSDPQWGKLPYWGGTMSNAGCQPTCLAAAVSGIKGKRITPDRLATGDFKGRMDLGLTYVKQQYGINYQSLAKTAEAYTEALKAGKIIITTIKGTNSSGPWTYTTNGHYILLYGYNDGMCKIMDPSGKGKAVAGQFCIKVSDAAKFTQSSSGPYALWGEKSSSSKKTTIKSKWKGAKLTKRAGTITGPTGKETYYNLNMSGVVKIMRRMGNKDKYWVRSDGAKMLGKYIMVAANLNVFPRGSYVDTSLGKGIVCDTGGMQGTHLDIATNW